MVLLVHNQCRLATHRYYLCTSDTFSLFRSKTRRKTVENRISGASQGKKVMLSELISIHEWRGKCVKNGCFLSFLAYLEQKFEVFCTFYRYGIVGTVYQIFCNSLPNRELHNVHSC